VDFYHTRPGNEMGLFYSSRSHTGHMSRNVWHFQQQQLSMGLMTMTDMTDDLREKTVVCRFTHDD